MVASYPLLNAEQEAACVAAIAAVESGRRDFAIAGYAGTGKTFTVAEMTRRLVAKGWTPYFCAVVGKAAKCLRDALRAQGLDYPVTTVSVLCQRRFEKKDGTPGFAAKKAKLPPKSFIVLDEASTTGLTMLLKFLLPGTIGVPIVMLGDPFQTSPVMDSENPILARTRIWLRHVQRQAAESPINQLASAMRTNGVWFYTPDNRNAGVDDAGNPQRSVFDFSSDRGLNVVPVLDWRSAIMASLDLAHPPTAPWLVSTNDERHEINRLTRAYYGFRSVLPQVGEMIRFTRNNTDTGTYNGEHAVVTSVTPADEENSAAFVTLDGYDNTVLLPADLNDPRWSNAPEAQSWEWGYASTYYTIQGSEYPHVRILAGKSAMSKSTSLDGRRQLYTAITRGRQQVDLYVLDYEFYKMRSALKTRLKNRERSRARRAADGSKPRKSKGKRRDSGGSGEPSNAEKRAALAKLRKLQGS